MIATVRGYMPTFQNQERLTFAKCEHAWSYGGKISILTRHIMNALAKDNAKVKALVTRLKLLSIVSVPFTMNDIRSISKNIYKSFQLSDMEGIALGSLSFTITTADACDSVATFTNAALILASQNTIKAFSSISLPLGFVMTIGGTVLRTIKIAKSLLLHNDLTRLEDIKSVLEHKLGIEAEVKEQKKEALLRAAPLEAVSILEKLFTQLENPISEEDVQHIISSVDKVKDILKKKVKTELLGLLANIVILSALSLFAVGTGGSVPFALLTIGFAIRLGALIYHDQQKKEII